MKGTVVFSEDKHTFPDSLRDVIIKTDNKGFGFSKVEPEGLILFDVPGEAEPESIPSTADRFVCIFGAEVPALDEDRQPWELLFDSKNNSIVAGYFVGDFSGERKLDSSHQPAFHAQEKLKKRMKSMWRISKENIGDLYEECKSKEFQDEVTELITSAGTIVLHFCNNKVLWFTNHDQGKHVFDGGIASDLHGWSVPKSEVVLPDADVELPDFEPAVPPKPVPKGGDKLKDSVAVIKAVPENYTGPRTEAGIYAQYDGQMRSPKDMIVEGKLKHWNQVKRWYDDVAEYAPEGAKQAFEKIIGKNGKPDATFPMPFVLPKLVKAEVRAKIERLKSQGLLETKSPAETLAAHFNKVESKDGVVAKITPVTEVKPAVLVPTLNEKSEEHTEKFKSKFLDKSLQVIEAPDSFDEKDYPTFLEKMGLQDWSQLYGLPLEGWQYLGSRSDLARLCMFSMIREIKRLRAGEKEVELPDFEPVRKAM